MRMKKITLLAIVALILSPFFIGTAMFYYRDGGFGNREYDEKVYVAIEAEGRVGVIDAERKNVVASIDLSEVVNGTFVKYTTHNVQVVPDGKTVLVTANVDRGAMGEGAEGTEGDVSDGLFDKVFFIDPLTDTIRGSLPIETNLDLAHIVADRTGTFAYAASQEKAEIYAMDLLNGKITNTITLEEGDAPHGMRLSPDDSRLYVALIGGKAIAEVNLKTGTVKRYPLSGAVIQVAVTADGAYAFGSVYDSKKVAWVNVATGEEGYINLPDDARGPVQLYASPDSRYLYVVNQGYYFDQPTGKTVYRIDITQKAVDQTIGAGDAPHGIVADASGKFVYVTNLLSEDVSIIDATTNREVARVKVGEMPNGISIWNRETGGTP